MFRNYFKTAIRNLKKQKFYAFINVSGLAIGIACCLLIVLYVKDELSYDKFNDKADRVYRVFADMKFGQMDGEIAVVSAPMAKTLVQDYPEVETATRFRAQGSKLIRRKEQEKSNIKEPGVIFADPEMFDIFSFKLLEGDRESILSEPNTLVLTKSKAEKYFPEGSAIGQILTIDNNDDYKVVGVMEDIPHNSHFSFDFFLAMEGLEESKQPIWVSHNFHTYILVKPGTDAKALEGKFPGMVEKYVGPQVQQFLNLDLEEFEESGNHMEYYLQP
ncbi:MAG: ABC transporter permease, partial [Bacteroidetes bacterium]|nr:ABC transporter permease [Bacteroidota bacterium]